MRLNELSPAAGSRPEGRRVGRGIGSGLGKTCGRGHKGLKSRSGGKVPAGFEGGQMPLYRRLPKYGFNSRLARVTAEIRTSELSAVQGETVTLAALRDAGLINSSIERARIMLSGEVARAFSVSGIKVTKGARQAIEAAGGKVED
jgi:large subunit ribosomal protein L15